MNEVAESGLLPGAATSSDVGWTVRVATGLIDGAGLIAVGRLIYQPLWSLVCSVQTSESPGVLGLVWCAGLLAYLTLLESGRWQATLGNRAMSLVVTDMDGHRFSPGRAAARCLLKVLYGIPLVVLVSLVLAIRSRGRQTFHDWAAGSVVIKRGSVDRVRA